MSAVRMSVPNTDYDAAQALLSLQGTVKPENSGPYAWQNRDTIEDMQKSAKMFWNCFLPSDVPTSPQIKPVSNAKPVMATSQYPQKFEGYKNKITARVEPKQKISELYKKYHGTSNQLNIQPKLNKNCSTPLKSKTVDRRHIANDDETDRIRKNVRSTRDVATQTEDYVNPNMELMESKIKKLYEKIRSLEDQLKEAAAAEESDDPASSDKDENVDNISYDTQNNDCEMSVTEDSMNESNGNYSNRIQYETPGRGKQRTPQEIRTNRVLTNHNVYANSNELIPIGDGHATVASRTLRHINWNSYTSATRKLLTAVFSRRILATHSLTGKPSPAFPNKPAKKKLDPRLVNDIVQTVVERCSVPENVVRTSITTKCADESKMFKSRQKNNSRKVYKKNRENIPPSSSGSDSDNY